MPRQRNPNEVQRLMAGTSYTGMLYRLMDKADRNNFFKLQKVYPREAMEYIRWLHHREDVG